jgi:hypothetical protein
MREMIERGALHPFTLRFRDGDLEEWFQREEGTAGVSGYQVITGATALMWALAVVLIPLGSDNSQRPDHALIEIRLPSRTSCRKSRRLKRITLTQEDSG